MGDGGREPSEGCLLAAAVALVASAALAIGSVLAKLAGILA